MNNWHTVSLQSESALRIFLLDTPSIAELSTVFYFSLSFSLPLFLLFFFVIHDAYKVTQIMLRQSNRIQLSSSYEYYSNSQHLRVFLESEVTISILSGIFIDVISTLVHHCALCPIDHEVRVSHFAFLGIISQVESEFLNQLMGLSLKAWNPAMQTLARLAEALWQSHVPTAQLLEHH